MPPDLDFNHFYCQSKKPVPFQYEWPQTYFLLSPPLPCVTSNVLGLDLRQMCNNPLGIFCDVVSRLVFFIIWNHFLIYKYFLDTFLSLITEIAIQGAMPKFLLNLDVLFPCFPGGVYTPAVEDDTGCFPQSGADLFSRCASGKRTRTVIF